METERIEPGPLNPNTVTITKKKKKSTGLSKSSSKKSKTAVTTTSGADTVEDDDYLVELLLDKKIVRGTPYYLVKWIGWPHSANTWEPVQHLNRCMWIVNEYEKEKALQTAQQVENSASDPQGVDGTPMLEHPSSEKIRSRYKYKPNRRMVPNEDSSDDVSEDDFSEVDVHVGLLHKCPPGKRIERILAVTSEKGRLQYLVQWKSLESNSSAIPAWTSKNCNIVVASSLNQKFPQEVIQFYENRICFYESLDNPKEEDRKAKLALQQSKERRVAEVHKWKNNGTTVPESDDDDDCASKAIDKERRKYDKFDVYESDLSSSSDEDILS